MLKQVDFRNYSNLATGCHLCLPWLAKQNIGGCSQVGENRIVSLELDEEASSAPAMIVRDDGAFRHEKQWRGAAVALPVFSLRTSDSVGVGEFEDIKKLVDVCNVAGACTCSSISASLLCTTGRIHARAFFLDLSEAPIVCNAGLRMIQLLPVNDTSVYNMWWDSYPYSSVSVSR